MYDETGTLNIYVCPNRIMYDKTVTLNMSSQ